MITEKIVYVTEDGEQFETRESAEQHAKRKNFESTLSIFLSGKDLTAMSTCVIFDFITENIKELSSMFEEN